MRKMMKISMRMLLVTLMMTMTMMKTMETKMIRIEIIYIYSNVDKEVIFYSSLFSFILLFKMRELSYHIVTFGLFVD